MMFAVITPALIIGAIAETNEIHHAHDLHGVLDVCGLLPDGAHGLGN
jgi:ammonia channel protein AmtB